MGGSQHAKSYSNGKGCVVLWTADAHIVMEKLSYSIINMMRIFVFHAIYGLVLPVMTQAAHSAITDQKAHMKHFIMRIWKLAAQWKEKTGAGITTSIRQMVRRNMKEFGMDNNNNLETRAVFTDQTVRVYQAFPVEIAEEVVRLGSFGPHFKMDRMSWIKPSFLWIMYRCGWGMKPGQERVLAADIKRTAFDYAVNNAVASSFSKSNFTDYKEWHQQVKQSDIRCQWDPERDIYGNPLDYRSLQIGLRREALRLYVKDWIVKIEDITGYVKMLAAEKRNGTDISKKLPAEKMYQIKTGISSLK